MAPWRNGKLQSAAGISASVWGLWSASSTRSWTKSGALWIAGNRTNTIRQCQSVKKLFETAHNSFSVRHRTHPGFIGQKTNLKPELRSYARYLGLRLLLCQKPLELVLHFRTDSCSFYGILDSSFFYEIATICKRTTVKKYFITFTWF